MLGWHLSATVLVMVLIGGLRSVAGPLVGALVLIGLEEVLKALTEHWKLAEGLIIILIVLALPNGVRQLLSMVLGSSEENAREAQPSRTDAKPAAEAGHG
jgi:branched-chain amino acid transport system permease protein